MGPHRGGGGAGFLHMLFGLVGFVLTLAVLAAIAFAVWQIAQKKGWMKRFGPQPQAPHAHGEPPHPHGGGPADALRILDERLARGELDVEDYRARRAALGESGYPPFHQPPQSPPEPG